MINISRFEFHQNRGLGKKIFFVKYDRVMPIHLPENYLKITPLKFPEKYAIIKIWQVTANIYEIWTNYG